MSEMEEVEKADLEPIANAARRFVVRWDETNGDPIEVADRLYELITALEHWQWAG